MRDFVGIGELLMSNSPPFVASACRAATADSIFPRVVRIEYKGDELMKRRTLPVMVAVLLVLSLSESSFARGWVYLGEAHVDGQADHDKINVGRSEG